MVKKLTSRQTQFIKKYLEVGNGTQAALATYNTSDPNVAKVIASENLTKPNIREALEEALRTSGLSLSVITNNLGSLANSKPEKISGDTVLKANTEILKLFGAYPDKKSFQFSYSVKDKIESMSFQQIKEEITKLDAELKEFLEEATPVPTQNSLE